MESARERGRCLAEASLARNDPTGWFEELYAGADADERRIQWAEMTPNPHLVKWLGRAQFGRAVRSITAPI